jgi:O-acetyl-ADP-ribose deacetylase (regulator of RNase III)
VAFPSISTGAYGFPVERAARVALRTLLGYLHDHPGAFDVVRMVLWSLQDFQTYREALEELAGSQQ